MINPAPSVTSAATSANGSSGPPPAISSPTAKRPAIVIGDGPNDVAGIRTNAYNLTRPHSGIGGIAPWLRVNNLLGNDT